MLFFKKGIQISIFLYSIFRLWNEVRKIEIQNYFLVNIYSKNDDFHNPVFFV